MSADSYDDGLVQLDREAITLRRYHFPSGTSKIIALQHVRGYQAEPLGLFMHRFRIWGSSDLRRWLPLDVRRPFRSTLITLDVPGTRPSPAFTPANVRTSSPRCWTTARRTRLAGCAPGVGQRLMCRVVAGDERDTRSAVASRRWPGTDRRPEVGWPRKPFGPGRLGPIWLAWNRPWQ